MVRKFLNDETGAVTIDWVALSSGILLLGIALIYGIFNTGVSNAAKNINASLDGVAFASVGSPPNLNGGSSPTASAAPMICGVGGCYRDTNGDGSYDQIIDTALTGDSWENIGMEIPPSGVNTRYGSGEAGCDGCYAPPPET